MSWRTCFICQCEYGGTIVPALMTCCTRHVCYDCAEQERNTKITQLKRNEKKIPCMFCGRKFHSSKDTPWVVNDHLIEVMGVDVDLTHVRETQASFRGMATNNRPRHHSNAALLNDNHDVRGSYSNNVNAAARPIDQGDIMEGVGNKEAEIIDLVISGVDSQDNGTSNHHTGTNLRRSRRRNLQNPTEAGDETQSFNNETVTSTSFDIRTEEREFADDIITSDNLEVNINRSTHNHDNGTALRRSKRVSRRNPKFASDETQSPRNQIIASARRSKRVRTEEIEVADDPIEIIINGSSDNRGVDRRRKSEVHQQRSEPTAFNFEAEDRLWIDAISKPDLDVYRVRCYNHIRTSAEDKFSRRMSEWCVNNGVMVTKLEIAKILPRNQWFDGEALRRKVASMDSKELREVCNQCDGFDSKEKHYIGSRKQFIEMKKGSILVLHTKGGYSQREPPQTLTFGIVEDDSLIAWTKEEANRRQCPLDLSDPLLPADSATRFGFMVKKVKWIRQGELQSVRGPHQVNWLVEASPLWLMKVGTKDENIARTAIRKMSSEEFMRNTHSINNQWTMG